MTTVDLARPLSLAFLSLSHDSHLHHPISCHDDQLIFIVVKVDGSKSDEDGDTHAGCDISRIILGVLHRWDNEFFGFEGGDLDPLDVFGFVD